MINRTSENRLLKLISFFPALAILGPRQVGKTTLAKKIMNQLPIEPIYLDLEIDADMTRLSDAEAYLRKHIDKCVIIDEVQRMPSLFPLLRGLIDIDRRPMRYILLGSANPSIIKYSSESLTGRIAYVELAPFNLMEVNSMNSNHKHWIYGGFPGAFLAEPAMSMEWLYAQIKNYVDRDLASFGMPASPIQAETFWKMIASRNGGIWNASDFARSMGITYHTVQNYLDFLEGAYLITRLHPYYINVGKRLVKAPKIYVRDSGILHRLLNISSLEQLYSNVQIGASWEGYVIEQIRQSVNIDFSLFYYRTHTGAECDLLLERGGKPIAGIEIKFTSAPTVSRGFVESIKDLKTEKNFIITPNSDAYTTSHNIQVCNLYDFLTKFLKEI